MGVLFVTPKDGYSFTAAVGEEVVVDATEGSLGAHGYPATDADLSALFIASGAGIRPGVEARRHRQRRRRADDGGVAGIEPGECRREVLKEILAPGAKVGVRPGSGLDRTSLT